MFIDVRLGLDAILGVGTCLHQRQQMGRVDLPQWTSAANAEIRFFVPAHQVLPGAARGRNQPPQRVLRFLSNLMLLRHAT